MNEYINIAEMMYQLTEYFSLSTSIKTVSYFISSLLMTTSLLSNI